MTRISTWLVSILMLCGCSNLLASDNISQRDELEESLAREQRDPYGSCVKKWDKSAKNNPFYGYTCGRYNKRDKKGRNWRVDKLKCVYTTWSDGIDRWDCELRKYSPYGEIIDRKFYYTNKSKDGVICDGYNDKAFRYFQKLAAMFNQQNNPDKCAHS